MGRLEVVSLTEAFFSGGARKQHTEVMLGLQERGYDQSALSINNEVTRENTHQPMEENSCYQRLAEAGIAIRSLGRKATGGIDYTPFNREEMAAFHEITHNADALMSVKEQPLRLVTQARQLRPPVIVELHRSDPDRQGRSLDDLKLAIKMGRVAGLIATAKAAKQAYSAKEIPGDMIRTIRNGIDLHRFYPSSEKRRHMREQLGINPEDPVISFVGRNDAMKDIPLFLQSARIYLGEQPNAHVLMCGAGINWRNLGDDIYRVFQDQPQLSQKVHLLGIRPDMDFVHNASDISASTSAYGETYPLCLMEGLACNAVPVATDVGDTADIVGQGRGILTSRHPRAIARAWHDAYENRPAHLAAIHATKSRFSRDRMIDEYDRTIRKFINA